MQKVPHENNNSTNAPVVKFWQWSYSCFVTEIYENGVCFPKSEIQV